MDLDYRALSNAGFWALGRLQTDADRARVVEGIRSDPRSAGSDAQLGAVLRRLAPRWFVVRDTHVERGPLLLSARHVLAAARAGDAQ